MDRDAGREVFCLCEGDLWADSPHPGGEALTARLAALAGIRQSCSVIDVASGRGNSALYLARTYRCRVTGVDVSGGKTDQARRSARESDAEDLLSFLAGDAGALPFRSGSFDVLICECSFSLIQKKKEAAREFYRVLRNGGRIAVADFYLKTHAACPAGDARRLCPPGTGTQETYRAVLDESGFHDIRFEDHTEELKELFISLMLAPGGMEALLDRLPDRSLKKENVAAVGYCVATGIK